jgi:hypothetical protein
MSVYPHTDTDILWFIADGMRRALGAMNEHIHAREYLQKRDPVLFGEINPDWYAGAEAMRFKVLGMIETLEASLKAEAQT